MNRIILILILVLAGCGQDKVINQSQFQTREKSILVMTYNLHLFDIADDAPSWLKGFVQAAMSLYASITGTDLVDYLDTERANKIADVILNLQGADSPDIIGFTELWTEDVTHRMLENLHSRYPYHYRQGSEPFSFSRLIAGKFAGNGLLLLSKYPIVPGSTTFTLFNDLTGADAATDKGVMGAEIQVGDERIAIFLTHTQAIYNTGDNSTTLKNIEQVTDVIKEYALHHPGEDILAIGDFNIPGDTPAYNEMNNMFLPLVVQDSYRIQWPQGDHPGYTYDTETNNLIDLFSSQDKNENLRQRLDYIFYIGNHHIKRVLEAETGSRLRGGFNFLDWSRQIFSPLSDHHPLFVRLAIN